jgi:hypothetical protein
MYERWRGHLTGVIAAEKSGNTKLSKGTGISATYASQATCPGDCPFLDKGCYGETGMTGVHTSFLNKSETTNTTTLARREAHAIDGLSGKRPLRLHVVGDARTKRAAQILSRAADRYKAKEDEDVWTYTHAFRTVPRSAWGSISVLASCETAEDVKLARSRGYATAIVLEEHEWEGRYVHQMRDSKGRFAGKVDVTPCPAQTRGVSCESCRLCFDDSGLIKRATSIAFAIHGGAMRKIRKALKACGV